MHSAWRIVKARYAATAFDGEGARRSGGRWNSPGTRVVYTSSTISLALLEMLVNLGESSVLAGYVLIESRFDAALVLTLPRAALPANWQKKPVPAEARAVGDQWVQQSRSAILMVPSVVVPQESNYLLNPLHPKFAAVKISAPVPFPFDARLVRSK